MGFFIVVKPENGESFQRHVVSKNGLNHMVSLDIYFFLLNWIHKKGCIGQKRKKTQVHDDWSPQK